MFNTIDEVYDYLFNQKKSAPRTDLSRISLAASLLNIKTPYKIIHVAGTNGKGSVCAYIKEMLSLKGLHVGMFVSPYVISFNERIQINDRYISNSEIMHYANILYTFNQEYEKKYNDKLPFFELTLLMALMWFSDRKIDVAVIECGLGGKLDSTNFLDCDMAVITNIGFDHMQQLGNTLESIADHKLGIAKPGMVCLTSVQEELRPYFDAYAKKNKVDMRYIDQVQDVCVTDKTEFIYHGLKYKSSLLGEYQAKNAALAIEVVHYFDNKYPNTLIEFALEHVFWPGRLEAISKKPLVFIDGAHNMPAVTALKDTLLKMKGDKKVKIMFSALQDKAYPEMIHILDEVTEYYYFTKIHDLRQVEKIDFSTYTCKPSESCDNFEEAFDKAFDEIKEDEILVVTGSLHFISMVREYYFKKQR